MAIPGNSFNIPHFLKAKTPELLQRSMLELNMIQGKEYKYFDISYAQGFWFAFYYESAETGLISGLNKPAVTANKVVTKNE